jgi:hypothetical protein
MEDVAVQVGNYTTSLASNSWSIASNFIILAGLTFMFLVVSYRSRSGMNIISLTLSFYVGYALFLVFPYTKDIVSSGGSPIMKATISVGIFVLGCIPGFLFVQRLVKGGIGLISVFPRLGLSFLGAAFLMALAYHVFHVNNIYTFPEPMNTIFAPDQYFFWWFAAPLIGLILLVH